MNQQEKSKNAIGSNNNERKPKKAREKVSNNKDGTLTNQNTVDDNLPVDTINIVPPLIISNKKENNN